MSDAAPADLYYVDHTRTIVKDIDVAAAVFERLGFFLSPLSVHMVSPRPGAPLEPAGTANRAAYFGKGWIELLGTTGDAPGDPWNMRDTMASYDGVEGVNLGAGDLDVVARRLTARGISHDGVLTLERDVETPDGIRTVRARGMLPDRGTPDLGLSLAQPLTPEYLHQPRYLNHPCGAVELTAVLRIVEDNMFDDYVAEYTKFVGIEPVSEGPRAVYRMSPGRVEVIPESALDDVLPGESAPALPVWAAQAVTVSDLASARSWVETNGFDTHQVDGGFFVRASDALGSAVIFLHG